MSAVYFYVDNTYACIATSKVTATGQDQAVQAGDDAEATVDQQKYKVRVLGFASKYSSIIV